MPDQQHPDISSFLPAHSKYVPCVYSFFFLYLRRNTSCYRSFSLSVLQYTAVSNTNPHDGVSLLGPGLLARKRSHACIWAGTPFMKASGGTCAMTLIGARTRAFPLRATNRHPVNSALSVSAPALPHTLAPDWPQRNLTSSLLSLPAGWMVIEIASHLPALPHITHLAPPDFSTFFLSHPSPSFSCLSPGQVRLSSLLPIGSWPPNFFCVCYAVVWVPCGVGLRVQQVGSAKRDPHQTKMGIFCSFAT